MNNSSEHFANGAPRLLCLTVCGVVVVGAVLRAFLGFNFWDEGFYIATSYHFVLGGKPWLDEVNIVQGAPILLFPLLKAFIALSGGTDALMLFCRLFYLLFVSGVAFVTYRTFTGRCDRNLCLLVAVVPLIFFPFNIPNFSYNTFCMGFFTLGCLLTLDLPRRQNGISDSVLAGIFHGLCLFCYPPMVVLPLVYAGGVYYSWRGSGEGKRFLKGYGIGLAAIAAGCVLLFVSIGTGPLIESLKNNIVLNRAGSLTERALFILDGAWKNFGKKTFVLPVLLLFYFISKKFKSVWPFLFMFAPLVYLPLVFSGSFTASMGLVINTVLFSLPIILFQKELLTKAERWCVFVPSLFAGTVTAFSSSNGFSNASLGLLPAFLLSLVVYGRYGKGLGRGESGSVFAAVLLVMISISQLQSSYFEDPPLQLNAQIEQGPFKGIFTTPEKKRYLSDLTKGVKSFTESRRICFNDCPGCYLLTDRRPNAKTLWMSPDSSLLPMYTQYFRDHHTPEDLYVQMKEVFHSREFKYAPPMRTIFVEEVEKYFKPAMETKEFKIYAGLNK